MQDYIRTEKPRIIYLIDYENVHETGFAAVTGGSDVYVFYTPNVPKTSLDVFDGIDVNFHFVKAAAGKQSLDMHLVSYLGYLIAMKRGEAGQEYVIVSNDTDFDNVINFWRIRGISCRRRNIVRQEAVSEAQTKVEPEGKVKPETVVYEVPSDRQSETKRSSRSRSGRSRRRTGGEQAASPAAEAKPAAEEKPVPEVKPVKEKPVPEAKPAKEKPVPEEKPAEEAPAAEMSFTAAEEEPIRSEAEHPAEAGSAEEAPAAEPVSAASDVEETEPAPAAEPARSRSSRGNSRSRKKNQPKQENTAPEKAEAVKEQPKTAAQKGYEKTQLNNKVVQLLNAGGFDNGSVVMPVAQIVSSNFGKPNARKKTYIDIIKKYGQKDGLKYYGVIKGEL